MAVLLLGSAIVTAVVCLPTHTRFWQWHQGIGIVKAVISLTLFHEGRMALMDYFKTSNKEAGLC